MAEILDLDKVEGFFRGLYLNTLNICTPSELLEFDGLSDDESRVIFIMKLQAYKDLKYTRVLDERNEINALQMKKLGNKAFLAKNWQLALEFYNNCVLQTPTGNGNELLFIIAHVILKFDIRLEFTFVFFGYRIDSGEQMAIALANRSAALYHLEKYDLALSDIALAEQSYPKELLYKLKERAARCHLAKKNLGVALKAFQ